MVSGACLKVAPVQLDLHHLAGLAVLPEMSNKCNDMMNALFDEEVMHGDPSHFGGAIHNLFRSVPIVAHLRQTSTKNGGSDSITLILRKLCHSQGDDNNNNNNNSDCKL